MTGGMDTSRGKDACQLRNRGSHSADEAGAERPCLSEKWTKENERIEFVLLASKLFYRCDTEVEERRRMGQSS
jgi:hypothetical protein